MSGLVGADGRLLAGHPSASQRRLLTAEKTIAHLRAALLVMLEDAGGEVVLDERRLIEVMASGGRFHVERDAPPGAVGRMTFKLSAPLPRPARPEEADRGPA